MDKVCIDCGISVHSGPRCKRCAAFERWRDRRQPARFCKMCGREITGSQRLRAIYCSRECRRQDPASYPGRSKNRVSKVCPGCNTTFEVPVSNADRYTFCSRACSASRGVDAVCKRCGSPFRHRRAERRHYCSEACRRPPVLIDCAHCGTSVRVVPSAAGRRRYCSRRCYVASDAETSIERAVRLILEGERLRFVAQAQVGPWVVDFRLADLLIEADGDYWHSLRPEADRRKTSDLRLRGFTVWRISETEITAPGFADSLRRRLIDYEITDEELPRLAPGEEPAVTTGQHAVRGRKTKRPRADIHENQITLSL